MKKKNGKTKGAKEVVTYPVRCFRPLYTHCLDTFVGCVGVGVGYVRGGGGEHFCNNSFCFPVHQSPSAKKGLHLKKEYAPHLGR